MALDLAAMETKMIAAAATTAGDQWTKIQSAATLEIRSLARTIVLISQAFLAGDISQSSAKRHLRAAREHMVATVAMLTTMVQAGVEKILRAVIAVVKESVNKAVGFVLL
jgi:hypothetical protein